MAIEFINVSHEHWHLYYRICTVFERFTFPELLELDIFHVMFKGKALIICLQNRDRTVEEFIECFAKQRNMYYKTIAKVRRLHSPTYWQMVKRVL